MKTWLERKTDKYTSHKIQNECMQLVALYIIRNVAQNICDSACFTIMADECTDVSNKEQFVIVIRWVSEDLQERESFIGLYEADSTDANRLVHSIKDVLLRLNVNISHCCGQCYHRALNIRGSRNRVATQILSLERRAVYMHCFGHALNLAVADTLKQSVFVVKPSR